MNAVAGRATGRRKPARRRDTLRLAPYLTGQLPAWPSTVDDTTGVGYGLDGNDRFGVCVPTGYDNYRRTTTKLLTGTQLSASQQDVFGWYRTQNPDFDPATGADDQGMNVQTFLEYLVKTGEIVAFAAVDPHNAAEVDGALYLFLAILYGVDLHVAQQAQTRSGVWDYQAGSSDWGGHCVVAPAYAGSDVDVISWAERVRTTAAFQTHQVEEAYVLVRREHLTNPAFRAGVDLAALAADYLLLTGRTLPIGPTPPSPADPDRVLWAANGPWRAARHTGKNAAAVRAELAWGASKGFIS